MGTQLVLREFWSEAQADERTRARGRLQVRILPDLFPRANALGGKVIKRHLLSGLWLGNFNRCFCPWTGKTEGKALFPEMCGEGYVERPYCENCAKQVHAYPAELRAGFPSFCNLPDVN